MYVSVAKFTYNLDKNIIIRYTYNAIVTFRIHVLAELKEKKMYVF